MSGEKPKGLLARHGAKLIRNGYRIVPIMRGEKFPPFNGWQETVADEALLKKWLSGEYKTTRGPKGQERDFIYRNGMSDGVGILAADTPGVDLDIKDEAVALEMEEYVRFLLGDAPIRIGDPPKRLLMYRTNEPFSKVQSAFWQSDDGKKHKVEILGDGQQYVAIHIHPDTKKPYYWLDGKNPTTVEADDLPEITAADARAIVAEFERIAAREGWKKASTALARPSSSGGKVDQDDPFAEDTALTVIGEDELRRKLLLVPGCEDYDTWFQIGMALHHQFEGGERGLELWHEWSELASNYDADVLDEKWPTFEIEGKGRAPVTARLIIKLAKKAQETLQKETLVEVEDQLKEATDRAALKEACDRIKKLEIDQLTRETLLGLVQKRFKIITGQPLRIAVARDMIRFENPDAKSLPHWLDGWVYCTHPETFYNMKTHTELTVAAFNNVYGRFMLTKKDILEGRSSPEHVASHVALHLHQIEIVENQQYMPNDDTIFWLNGRKYVNSYSDRNVPEAPDTIPARDRRNVEIVVGHAAHLFPVERDRELFLDYLAHLIQGGERPDWAILLQGVQKDGKTFFARLLSSMLGFENVNNLTADALDEKYSPWAEGVQVNFFEEIKLHGHNRYDVLNRLKPKISNSVVDVRRMGVDRYQVVNTAAYILTTNFRDAIPIEDGESRYLILFSRFQREEQLKEWKAKPENQHYYRDLHDALDQSRGAIRRWFLDRVPGPEFNHVGRAPDSAARREMIGYTMSDERSILDEIVDDSPELDLSSVLLNSRKLSDEMHARDQEPPYGRAMTRMLLDAGFTRLKKVRVGDTIDTYWSRSPERFRAKPGSVKGDWDEAKIREWLNPGL